MGMAGTVSVPALGAETGRYEMRIIFKRMLYFFHCVHCGKNARTFFYERAERGFCGKCRKTMNNIKIVEVR